MGLQEKLTRLKNGFESQAPKEIVEVMHRATDDLEKSGILDSTVKVGDQAPDFSLKNADGQEFSLKDLLSHGPVVLSFYRGKWWPYCNLELDALKKAAGEFKALGATFIAISPQLQTYNKELREEKKLTFEILSDPGNQVAQRYGLKFQLPEDLREVYLKFDIDLPRYNGDDSWTLPLPTTLIIDQNGIIQHGAINADYTVRPDPEETVAALKKIVA